MNKGLATRRTLACFHGVRADWCGWNMVGGRALE